MDVGDDRHRRPRHDARQALGRLDLVARAPHDVGTGGVERVDLRQRSVDVGRLRDRHRLHRDRRVAPHRDRMGRVTQNDLPRLASRELSVDEHQFRLIGLTMSRKIVDTPENDEHEHDRVRERQELHHVDLIAATVPRADALVGGDRDMPTVERQQRDQVEQPDDDVDAREEQDEREWTFSGELAADPGGADDGDGSVVVGTRLVRGRRRRPIAAHGRAVAAVDHGVGEVRDARREKNEPKKPTVSRVNNAISLPVCPIAWIGSSRFVAIPAGAHRARPCSGRAGRAWS